MNKTKIEWADLTWNPVTGCLHGCPYCYARKIAERFSGGGYGKQDGIFIGQYREDAFTPPYDLTEPQLAKTKGDWYREAPYPFGFEPTFHRYRLREPAGKIKPQNIFVCSMADLFGEWVPDEWIQKVFEACAKVPQHNYMFLTKNPARYTELYGWSKLPQRPNMWYGSTATTPENLVFSVKGYQSFISFEPLLAPFPDIAEIPITANWVIIGAETGNRKEKVIPKREWIDELVATCREYHIPVFMKDSLIDIVGEENMLRQFPDGLRRDA